MSPLLTQTEVHNNHPNATRTRCLTYDTTPRCPGALKRASDISKYPVRVRKIFGFRGRLGGRTVYVYFGTIPTFLVIEASFYSIINVVLNLPHSLTFIISESTAAWSITSLVFLYPLIYSQVNPFSGELSPLILHVVL